mmetsp:Transcript_75692/g.234253  ORF Transcript_75692/g.234253 Transcript_75692/m.234253 type:complete len:182 (-) Transcript_75692:518-1063(-)
MVFHGEAPVLLVRIPGRDNLHRVHLKHFACLVASVAKITRRGHMMQKPGDANDEDYCDNPEPTECTLTRTASLRVQSRRGDASYRLVSAVKPFLSESQHGPYYRWANKLIVDSTRKHKKHNLAFARQRSTVVMIAKGRTVMLANCPSHLTIQDRNVCGRREPRLAHHDIDEALVRQSLHHV